MKELQKTFKEFTNLESQLRAKRTEMIDMANHMLKKVFGSFLWVEETFPDEQDGMFLMSKSIPYNEEKKVTLPGGESIIVIRDDYGKDGYVDISEIVYDFFEDHGITIVCDVIAMVSKEDAEKIRNALTNTLTEKSQEEGK